MNNRPRKPTNRPKSKVIRMMHTALKYCRGIPMTGGVKANKKRHSKPCKYGPDGRVEKRIKQMHGGEVPAGLESRVRG